MVDKKKVWEAYKRIFIIAGWTFAGWLFGSLIGYWAFEATGETIGRWVGLIAGFLWGFKSNTSWFFY